MGLDDGIGMIGMKRNGMIGIFSTEMWPGQTHFDPHKMRMAHHCGPSISGFGNSLEGFISLRRCVEPDPGDLQDVQP